ncbi:MAG: sporulation transcriptional regulator SpoIIID [Clostridiales bacterium]|nr:sporulation transcriptional regulator SpoIIID [Clostridiales bacterium]
MKDYIEERVIEIANYIAESGATVREAAKVFKVSKSTVHKDVAERLPKINPALWAGVKKVLDQNKAERHIRGGRATRIKYKSEKENSRFN